MAKTWRDKLASYPRGERYFVEDFDKKLIEP
jgi:hypothetical protein